MNAEPRPSRRPGLKPLPNAMPTALRLGLLVLTALRFITAARAPLSADEAYYWVWSKALAPGFVDHPPMVALWIRAGTAIAGNSTIGIRLLGPIAALLGSLLLYRAARDFSPHPKAGLIAVLLLNATLALNAGAVILTPDTPLLFFWTAALWALGRLLHTGQASWWLAVGAAAGLALDSKYSALLLGLALAIWLLATPGARPWLKTWQLWAGGALALLLFAPVLRWNAAHAWVSFAKQGGRTENWHPATAGKFVGELIAGQVGMATPWVAVLFTLGCIAATRAALRRPRAPTPTPALLACLTLVPAAVFLQHTLGDRVQANWPAIIYPGAALAAAWAGLRHWRPAAATGLLISLLIFIQAAFAPFPLPRKLDFTLIRLAGWSNLTGQLYATLQSQHADYVATDSYGLASELAFHGLQNVAGTEPRWAHFNLPPANLANRTGILIRSLRDAGPPDARLWANIQPLGTIARTRAGHVAETYALYRVAWQGGAVLQPAWLPHIPPAPPRATLQ